MQLPVNIVSSGCQ